VAEESIKVGDQVSLRTGGPVMAVQARSQNLAYCAWQTDGRLHYGTFEVGSLRLAPDAAQSGSCGADDGIPCG
jgi:uncharacterized protein YodC (DUF2158 family)